MARDKTGNFRNYILNGAFDYWQRGPSTASAGTVLYSADRWYIGRDVFATGMTVSQQTGVNTNFCARIQRDNGNAGTGACYFNTILEIRDVKELAGKYVTFSFRARRGANFSATSNQLRARLVNGTGTTQQTSNTVFNAGFTGQNAFANQLIPITSTSTFDRYSVSGLVPTNATQMYIELSFTPTGTAGAADYVEVSEAMLNEGPFAAPFQRANASLPSELAACQRYYEPMGTSEIGAAIDGRVYHVGQTQSTTSVQVSHAFKVQKRVTPTMTYGAAANWRWADPAAGALAPSAIVTSNAGVAFFSASLTVTGATNGRVAVASFVSGSGNAWAADSEI